MNWQKSLNRNKEKKMPKNKYAKIAVYVLAGVIVFACGYVMGKNTAGHRGGPKQGQNVEKAEGQKGKKATH